MLFRRRTADFTGSNGEGNSRHANGRTTCKAFHLHFITFEAARFVASFMCCLKRILGWLHRAAGFARPDDFRCVLRGKTKVIRRGIGENCIRVIPKTAECFRPKQPSEERVFIAHSISNRMDSDKPCALRKMKPAFCGVKGGLLPNVRKFTGVYVVNTPRIVAAIPDWPNSSCNQERDNRRTV